MAHRSSCEEIASPVWCLQPLLHRECWGALCGFLQRQGGIRAASCASSSHTEGAGWDMGWAGSTEQIPLDWFEALSPHFTCIWEETGKDVGHLRLKTFQGTKWVEEGWSFPVECAPVAACRCFGGRSGQGILVKGLRIAAYATDIT